MPFIDDLKELLHPEITANRIVQICQQYGVSIDQAKIADADHLKSLTLKSLPKQFSTSNPADDPQAQKHYLLATLAYRTGWHDAATLVRLKDFDLFADAATLVKLEGFNLLATEQPPATLQPVDPNQIELLAEFRFFDLSTQQLTTETARLSKYTNTTTLSLINALEILGIRDTILTPIHISPKFFPAGNRKFTCIPSALEKIYRSLADNFAGNNIYQTALKILKMFIDHSNALAFEQYNQDLLTDKLSDTSSICDAAQSYHEKTRSIAHTDIITCGTWLAEATLLLKRIDDFLVQITATQEKLPVAPSSANPFQLSFIWFPEQIRLLRQYGEATSSLMQSVRAILKKFDDHMQAISWVSAVLITCLEAAQNNTYTDENENLLTTWQQNQITRTTPKTKVDFEQASQALTPLTTIPPDAPLNTTLATLDKYFPGSKKKIENYSKCIIGACRDISAFLALEEQAKAACTQRMPNLTWQNTKIETALSEKVLQVRKLIPEKLTGWDTLLTRIHNNCQFGYTEPERQDRLAYLGLLPKFSRVDLLTAFNTFEQELKAFLAILEIANDRGLSYPDGTNNDYTRQRTKAQEFNFKEKNHFALALTALKTEYQKEKEARQNISIALTNVATVLPANYGNNYLTRFVARNLQMYTYQEVMITLEKCIREETEYFVFLGFAKILLFNPDLTTIPGESYSAKFSEFQIRFPARINLIALKALPPVELKQAIMQEKHAQTQIADLRKNLDAWLPHHHASTQTITRLTEKYLSFQEALTELNRNIQREYDIVVDQYDRQLEAAYRKSFKISKPKQEALDQLNILRNYKTAVVARADMQPIEQYVLLLGALKKALDNTQALPQHGKQASDGNPAFFKKLEIDADLVAVLKNSLAVVAPVIVQQRAFLPDTLALDHPMLTTAVEIMQAHATAAVLAPETARSQPQY